jgi:hypothetical protein
MLPQMLSFCRIRRQESASTRVLPSSSVSQISHTDIAARAQASGIARLGAMSTIRRTVSLPSVFGHSRPISASESSHTALPKLLPPPIPVPTAAEKAAKEAEELAQDERTVKREFEQYLADGLTSNATPLNLVAHWDVSTKISVSYLV